MFEYYHGTKECDDCNAIVIKAGSFMSKHTVCLNKWYDCKWIDDARDEAVLKSIVEDFDEDYYIFIKDMPCDSPIKAASVVLGHIEADSWDLMKNEKGESLREVYRK